MEGGDLLQLRGKTGILKEISSLRQEVDASGLKEDAANPSNVHADQAK